MVKLDMRYLYGPKKHRYWYYRRNGRFIPITSPEGRRLQQDEGECSRYSAAEPLAKAIQLCPAGDQGRKPADEQL